MELILLIAALLLLDLLALRFGVDSRFLDLRDGRGWGPALLTGDPWHDSAQTKAVRLHHEAHLQRLASLASLAASGRPSLRIRLADALRAVAVRIDPVCAQRPTGGLRYGLRHSSSNGVVHALPH
jgi:hypothetical protein